MKAYRNGLSRRDFLVQTALVTGALALAPGRFAFAEPKLASSTRGMVTSPHVLASEAGLKVLQEGGNAAEAAIAMGAVISVVYPHFSGIGGDGLWIVADREGRKTVLMGIGQAAEKYPDYGDEIPLRGAPSTLTSAAQVDAWGRVFDHSRDHWDGTQSFASLLDAAIGYAENGFPASGSQVFWQDFRKDDLASWPGFSEVFLPGGKPVAEGDNFVQQQLAESLKLIAANGPRDFYEGELAERIARGLADVGSPLTAEDLKKTVTRAQDPVSVDYRGLTLLAPPPPTQGVSTLGIMGVLNQLDLASVPEGSADYYHLCVEAVKQAFLDRGKIADPAFVDQAVDEWLSDETLKRKADAIDREKAMPWPHVFQNGDTVFFGATDSEGRSVSVLQSLFFDWGSGVMVGDTGILWQNRGGAFSLDPDSPNVLAPGKLPFYTLNPGMALKDDKPHIIYGTQGADGQPQTLSVVLTRMIDYGYDPLKALAAPRFLLGQTFSDSRDSLKLEEDAGEDVFTELAARGHEMSPIPANSPLGGQAGAIIIHDDGRIEGAHDTRSDGQALGL